MPLNLNMSNITALAEDLERFSKQIPQILTKQLLSKMINLFIEKLEKWEGGEVKDIVEKNSAFVVPFSPSVIRFETALLFIDISGFTILSQRLPVDELKSHINAYFSKILGIVSAYGGDVVKFAGDALFIEWPIQAAVDVSEEAKQALLAEKVRAAVACGMEIIVSCCNYRISFAQHPMQYADVEGLVLAGNYASPKATAAGQGPSQGQGQQPPPTLLSLSQPPPLLSLSQPPPPADDHTFLNVHAGAGVGMMAGLDVGCLDRCEYIILGEPLAEVAQAEAEAEKGDLVISQAAHNHLCGAHHTSVADDLQQLMTCGCHRTAGGCYKVSKAYLTKQEEQLQIMKTQALSEANHQFLALHRVAALSMKGLQGEHRERLLAAYCRCRARREREQSLSPSQQSSARHQHQPQPHNPPSPKEGEPIAAEVEAEIFDILYDKFLHWWLEILIQEISLHVHEADRSAFSFSYLARESAVTVDALFEQQEELAVSNSIKQQPSPSKSKQQQQMLEPAKSEKFVQKLRSLSIAMKSPTNLLITAVTEQQPTRTTVDTSTVSSHHHQLQQQQQQQIMMNVAELRQVIVMFINIKSSAQAAADSLSFQPAGSAEQDSRLLASFQGCRTVMVTALKKSGGQLRQFIVDDKGTVGIGTYGLRGSANYDNAAAAVEASRRIIAGLKALQIDCSIGLTVGNAYCGLVGSFLRHEYAVMGPSVNLSARLMGKGKAGEILCDLSLKSHDGSHRFEERGTVVAKGYSKPVAIYSPLVEDDEDDGDGYDGYHEAEDDSSARKHQIRQQQGNGGGGKRSRVIFQSIHVDEQMQQQRAIEDGSSSPSEGYGSPTPGTKAMRAVQRLEQAMGEQLLGSGLISAVGRANGGKSDQRAKAAGTAMARRQQQQMMMLGREFDVRLIYSYFCSCLVQEKEKEGGDGEQQQQPIQRAMVEYLMRESTAATSGLQQRLVDLLAAPQPSSTQLFNREMVKRSIIIQGASGIGKSTVLHTLRDRIIDLSRVTGDKLYVVYAQANTYKAWDAFISWRSTIRRLLMKIASSCDPAYLDKKKQYQLEQQAAAAVETGNDKGAGGKIGNEWRVMAGLQYLKQQGSFFNDDQLRLLPFLAYIHLVAEQSYPEYDAKVAMSMDAEMLLTTLGDLLAAIVQAFIQTTRRVLVILFDDCHFMDRYSWELITLLWSKAQGIITISTSSLSEQVERDGLRAMNGYERKRLDHLADTIRNPNDPLSRLSSDGRCLEVELDSLPSMASQQIMQSYFHANQLFDVPEEILNRLEDISGGKPMYVHEVTKSFLTRYYNLLDEQVASGETEQQSAAVLCRRILTNFNHLAGEEARGSRIAELVYFRFDRLSARSQIILKMSSVAAEAQGSPFSFSMLFELSAGFAQELEQSAVIGFSSETQQADVLAKEKMQAYLSRELAKELYGLLQEDEFVRLVDDGGSRRSSVGSSQDSMNNISFANSLALTAATLAEAEKENIERMRNGSFVFKVTLEQKAIYALLLEDQKKLIHLHVAQIKERDRTACPDDVCNLDEMIMGRELTSSELFEEAFHWERAQRWSQALIGYYLAGYRLEVQHGLIEGYDMYTAAYRMLLALFQQAEVTIEFFEICPEVNYDFMLQHIQREIDGKDNDLAMGDMQTYCQKKYKLYEVFEGQEFLLQACLQLLNKYGQVNTMVGKSQYVPEKLFNSALQMVVLIGPRQVQPPTVQPSMVRYDLLSKGEASHGSSKKALVVEHGLVARFGLASYEVTFSILSNLAFINRSNLVFRKHLLQEDQPLPQPMSEPYDFHVEETIATISLLLAKSYPVDEVHEINAHMLQSYVAAAKGLFDAALDRLDKVQQLYNHHQHSDRLIRWYGADLVPFLMAKRAQILMVLARFKPAHAALGRAEELRRTIIHVPSKFKLSLSLSSVYAMVYDFQTAKDVMVETIELQGSGGSSASSFTSVFFKEINRLYLSWLNCKIEYSKYVASEQAAASLTSYWEANEDEKRLLDGKMGEQFVRNQPYLYHALYRFGGGVEYPFADILLSRGHLLLLLATGGQLQSDTINEVIADEEKRRWLEKAKTLLSVALVYAEQALAMFSDNSILLMTGQVGARKCQIQGLFYMSLCCQLLGEAEAAQSYRQQAKEVVTVSIARLERDEVLPFFNLSVGGFLLSSGLDRDLGQSLQAKGLAAMELHNPQVEDLQASLTMLMQRLPACRWMLGNYFADKFGHPFAATGAMKQ